MTEYFRIPYLIWTIFTLSFFFSCGKKEQAQMEKQFVPTKKIAEQSVIVGSVDWADIADFPSSSRISTNAKFVGKIDLPEMGSRCTGFLISEDVLLTNEHCVPAANYARNVTVIFNYQSGVSESQQRKYVCDKFIGNNKLLDYALLECEEGPGATLGFATLADSPSSLSEAIYVIHQNCDYYSSQNCNPYKIVSKGSFVGKEEDYFHNADTLGGSSGSPVFSSSTHAVIALHHVGLGNNGVGRGYRNAAVPMEKIVPSIRANFSNVQFRTLNAGSNPKPAPTPIPNPASYEPNDSFSTAFTILLGSRLEEKISSVTDFDYFKFTVSNAKSISVSLTLNHNEGDLDLALYDSSQKLLSKSDSTSNKEQINKFLGQGNYLIKIYGYRGAKASYHLSLD